MSENENSVTRRTFLIGTTGVAALQAAGTTEAETDAGFGRNFGYQFGTTYVTDDDGGSDGGSDGSDDDGSEDDTNDGPTADPSIDRLLVSDTSNPRNPHVDLDIHWAASISEGELSSAELSVSDSDEEVIFTDYQLDGQTAEGALEQRIKHGAGELYIVDITVYSTHDTDAVEEESMDT